jgi:pantoate--beta-alanine ligase
MVSIFVNPRQFNVPADFTKYPRSEARDLAICEAEGVDLVFAPEPDEIYPPDFDTVVAVGAVARPLEGAARPGHFDGVATVVAILFDLVGADRAYFGQKDAQQVMVIRQMARDLAIATEVVACPTVREPDGLALSSRNVHLSPAERAAAPVLHRALVAARERWLAGERSADALRAVMRAEIDAEPLADPDYVSVADAATLAELDRVDGPALLSLAVRFGSTRLIDNEPLGVLPATT